MAVSQGLPQDEMLETCFNANSLRLLFRDISLDSMFDFLNDINESNGMLVK